MDSSDEEQGHLLTSDLNFETLKNLQEKIGLKKFNGKLLNKKTQTSKVDKRNNKNRPREISSKCKKVAPTLISKSNRNIPRDPRFDSLCGEFNQKEFSKAYCFIDKLKKKEKASLTQALRNERDPTERSKIKLLLQRMTNQERSKRKLMKDRQKQLTAKKQMVESMQKGIAPNYKAKVNSQISDIVDMYEELNSKGKLSKHIKKKTKRGKKFDIDHKP